MPNCLFVEPNSLSVGVNFSSVISRQFQVPRRLLDLLSGCKMVSQCGPESIRVFFVSCARFDDVGGSQVQVTDVLRGSLRVCDFAEFVVGEADAFGLWLLQDLASQ